MLILYGLIGIANVSRGILDFLVMPTLASRPLALPLPLLGTVYVIWGIVLGVAGVLFLKKPGRRTRLFVLATAVVYQITVWIIHFVGDLAAYARELWLRDAILSALFLLAVFLLTILPASRKSVRERR